MPRESTIEAIRVRWDIEVAQGAVIDYATAKKDIDILLKLLERFEIEGIYRPRLEDAVQCERCGDPIVFAMLHAIGRNLPFSMRAGGRQGTYLLNMLDDRDGLPSGKFGATYVKRDLRSDYPRQLFRQHSCPATS